MASGCEYAFKAFERIQCTMKIMTLIVSNSIPRVWGALQSRDSKIQSNHNRSQPKALLKEAPL